jgi:uncharacterized SAM-binding protein YcdF (DUF218 family)
MYILSKFVIALISPLGAALFLSGCALLLGLFRFRRLAWTVGLFVWIWLGVWSLPVASDRLRATLEGQFPPVTVSALPVVDAIVVLGGGVTPPSMGSDMPNLEGGADRVWFGARLFHAGKAPLVVLSGGSDPEYSAFSEAESMALFMVTLGVERDVLLLESASRNTSQNAVFTAALLAERGINRILLVTSALHMPRAAARFEEAGMIVIPAPTDHEVLLRPGWQRWLPDTGALDGSARAMKEWVGFWVGR